MKPDPLNPANAEEREAVVVLQPSELPLDGGAAAVALEMFQRALEQSCRHIRHIGVLHEGGG